MCIVVQVPDCPIHTSIVADAAAAAAGCATCGCDDDAAAAAGCATCGCDDAAAAAAGCATCGCDCGGCKVMAALLSA